MYRSTYDLEQGARDRLDALRRDAATYRLAATCGRSTPREALAAALIALAARLAPSLRISVARTGAAGRLGGAYAAGAAGDA